MRRVLVREVVVHGERLADAELVHHDEAQAVDEAVGLVSVASEVLEGGVLVGHRDLVDLAESAVVEAAADLDSLGVALREVRGLSLEADRRKRFGDHVVGRDHLLPQRAASVGVQDLEGSLVVLVPLGHERQEEARVEEDHRAGFP